MQHMKMTKSQIKMPRLFLTLGARSESSHSENCRASMGEQSHRVKEPRRHPW
jgi:hypothetical protein